jgi:hypothetical protein
MQVMDDTDLAPVINLPAILLNINIHPHPLKEISILTPIPSKVHDETKTNPAKEKQKQEHDSTQDTLPLAWELEYVSLPSTTWLQGRILSMIQLNISVHPGPIKETSILTPIPSKPRERTKTDPAKEKQR